MYTDITFLFHFEPFKYRRRILKYIAQYRETYICMLIIFYIVLLDIMRLKVIFQWNPEMQNLLWKWKIYPMRKIKQRMFLCAKYVFM